MNYRGETTLKLRINESKYNLDWKEIGTETIYIGDERYRLPIYEKRLYPTIVIQVVPEENDNKEEIVWTVYYTPEFGRAGFKFVETGFFDSVEAMDYVDNELIGKFDIFDIINNAINEDVDTNSKDLAEQVLETFKSDVDRLKSIYASYMKLYKENKDNSDKLLDIADKIASITINIPDVFNK